MTTASAAFDPTGGSPGQVKFFLPGPVWVRRGVREAMAHEAIGHRGKAFADLYADIPSRLRRSSGRAASSSRRPSAATGLWEAALLNLAPERVLAVVSGAFSERWAHVRARPRLRRRAPGWRRLRLPDWADPRPERGQLGVPHRRAHARAAGQHRRPRQAGQVVARLDPQNQQNALPSAQANLSAAQGQLTQARNTFDRQRSLIEKGFTTRAQFDDAQRALQTAEAQVDSNQAQLRNAQDQLSYTELQADAAGTVTAKGAEPGEVVRAGQMIVQVARQGGRDAVFDVPAQLVRRERSDKAVITIGSLTTQA